MAGLEVKMQGEKNVGWAAPVHVGLSPDPKGMVLNFWGFLQVNWEGIPSTAERRRP